MNEHTEENRFEVARNRLRQGWAFATGVGREMRGLGAPFARGVGTAAQYATVGVGGMVAAGLPAYLVSKYGFDVHISLALFAGFVSCVGGVFGIQTLRTRLFDNVGREDNAKKIARGIVGIVAGSVLGVGSSIGLQKLSDELDSKAGEEMVTRPTVDICFVHQLKTGDQLIRKGPDGVPVLTVCP